MSSTVFQGWIPMGKGEASEQEGTRKLLWVEGSIWGQGWGGGGQVTFPSRKVLAPALNQVQASLCCSQHHPSGSRPSFVSRQSCLIKLNDVCVGVRWMWIFVSELAPAGAFYSHKS